MDLQSCRAIIAGSILREYYAIRIQLGQFSKMCNIRPGATFGPAQHSARRNGASAHTERPLMVSLSNHAPPLPMCAVGVRRGRITPSPAGVPSPSMGERPPPADRTTGARATPNHVGAGFKPAPTPSINTTGQTIPPDKSPNHVGARHASPLPPRITASARATPNHVGAGFKTRPYPSINTTRPIPQPRRGAACLAPTPANNRVRSW